ncbi:hypothetical protein AQI95_16485 [Streptomyces yokosukanensis]|uniref:SnoaL-like domain-containing protein n=1 Tax=Streptomyces yokosukanensis TaxID=67386 RepID=A0A101P549_9ACTN|nr:nuclear transport factor 2 family protein [Streptomyces yokosukanensis]KUN05101.1 hypothetical protein AQI95_16485 [Streptomyces yokosukanensis]
MTTTQPTTGIPLTPATGIALFERWTALWNGDFSDPEAFLAPGFRIRFANAPERAAVTDAVHGAAGIVGLISDFRAQQPALVYTVDGTALVDAGLGQVACRWYVTQADGTCKSGIDQFQVVDGRISAVWSVSGLRRFAD